MALLLGQEEAKKEVAQHFSDQIKLLNDMLEYGANLILRAFNSSRKELTDIVVCGVLLKQIVSMLAAVRTLIENGMVQAAFLPARAAFEAWIYSEWIILSDADRKARFYIVSNLRNERLWALRGIQGTPEGAEFDHIPRSIGLDIHANNPTLNNGAKKQLSEINQILAEPDFIEIDQEFEKRKGKRKLDLQWYKLVGGCKSIRDLAKAVGRLAEYETFYNMGSKITHSASFRDQILFGKNVVHFKPIPNLEGIENLLSFIFNVAIKSFLSTLQYYRPSEVQRFGQKYAAEWRKSFQNIKSVKYTYE
jgi:hypothetical protein